jgi:SAM-dependent methyltransferase
MSRDSTRGYKAFNLLKGRGIEIGALSRPFDLDAEVVYADRASTEDLREIYQGDERLSRGIVEVSFVMPPPRYGFPGIPADSFDFVISGHVLEHHPNPIYALLEQFRVIKKGGYLYCVIPNKVYTYDRGRLDTPIPYLDAKYTNLDFSTDENIAIEISQYTIGHEAYNADLKVNVPEILEKPRIHHFYVFSPGSVFDLLLALGKYVRFGVEYLSCEGGEIHFALRKESSSC